MERKQRVAKLEALLARVQSRSNRGETHGNAAVAIAQPAAAPPVARLAPAAAPVASPVVHASPPQVAATPKPAPVAARAAASAPPPQAEPARPAARPELAAHEMQEEVATVVRDVPVEALAAIAAASAQQQAKMTPAAGTPATVAAPPPAAGQPAPSMSPAFRGTSAFGGLSKKMTLIGTAPPANWPPRGAEASVPPPEPAPVPAAKAEVDEDSQTAQMASPVVEATESEGDVDALLGDESTAPPVAVEDRPAPERAATAPMVAVSPTVAESKKSDLPIVAPEAPLAKKQSRSGSTVVAMIVLWLIAMAAIWFVYRKSM